MTQFSVPRLRLSRTGRALSGLALVMTTLSLVGLPGAALGQGQSSQGSQVGIGDGGGRSREEIWVAPTAEDWAKPVLITFQRTWEDALAVARESGRPILICVNMDGEIASEHYAGVRYRRADVAALYEPYVCVIASVYRHTPRDYDRSGERILCPRFGSVTCGEHIALEPILFERFFEGTRVAPRHIAIELDAEGSAQVPGGHSETPAGVAQDTPNGSEAFDVYYAFDIESVLGLIEENVRGRSFAPRDAGFDGPPMDLVASRDIRQRERVEAAFRDGDRETRRGILRRVAELGDPVPVDLLRQAIFSLDVELSAMAREILSRSNSQAVVDLIAEALRVPMDPAERDALIHALERIGEDSKRARTLAVVHQGLASRSENLKAEEWTRALSDAESQTPERSALESKIAYTAELVRVRPADWQAKLELAEASLGLALDPGTLLTPALGGGAVDRFMRLHLEEAHRSALEAERLGARGWRVQAILALSTYYLGHREEAYGRAEEAVDGLPPGEEGWTAMAALGLFAEARREAIQAALEAKQDWPEGWIADVHDAYTVLENHPLGTAEQVVAHYDFLDQLGAAAQAMSVLEHGLARFGESWDLHARLRQRLLQERGIEGLEETYARMLERGGAAPNLGWFAGYASIVAGEQFRSGGRVEPADAAYRRAVGYYDANIERNPESRGSSDFYAAMALLGRARVALMRADMEASMAWLEEGFARDSHAADVLDGLNASGVGTALHLRTRALKLKRDDLVERVDIALSKLDPSQLLLPAFEAGGPRPQGAGGAGGAAR